MSQTEPKGIYVYQPFGMQDGKERWNPKTNLRGRRTSTFSRRSRD